MVELCREANREEGDRAFPHNSLVDHWPFDFGHRGAPHASRAPFGRPHIIWDAEFRRIRNVIGIRKV